jgi:hypothetical protein
MTNIRELLAEAYRLDVAGVSRLAARTATSNFRAETATGRVREGVPGGRIRSKP